MFGHNGISFSSLDVISANEIVVKIVRPDDPRGQESDFLEAEESVGNGLKTRKIWIVIPKHEVREDSLVMWGRFILTLKNVGTPEEIAKAKYISQGYKDGRKQYFVYDTKMLRASSIRLILSVSAVMNFRLFSHNVTQAYLQGN